MIQGIEKVDRNVFMAIEKKLEVCRSQANNPDSQEYKRAMQEAFADEDDPVRKYAKLSEEQQRRDDAYIESTAAGVSRPWVCEH